MIFLLGWPTSDIYEDHSHCQLELAEYVRQCGAWMLVDRFHNVFLLECVLGRMGSPQSCDSEILLYVLKSTQTAFRAEVIGVMQLKAKKF